MSARNKELINLGFAAIVASAAFASVSIVGTGLVSARWLGYVGVIFGLYLVAHVVARFTVPYADPTLLPLVGLLTALGLTVIYRLGPDDARRQAVWVAVGIGVLACNADLAAVRLPRARALQVHLRDLGRRPAAAAVGAGARLPRQRRQAVDQARPDAVPAGRAGEDLHDHLPRRVPPGQARGARPRTPQGPRAAARDLGCGDARARADERPRLGTPQLRDLPRDGLHRHRPSASTSAIGIVLFVGGAAALYNALDRVQQRVTVWLHPWTDDKVYCTISGKLDYRQNCDSYQLVKSLYSIANGGYGGTGLGKGTFTTLDGTQLIPYLNTDFIYSAIAQELGLIGAAGMLLI